MDKMKFRLWSGVLCLCMVCVLLPTAAFAEADPTSVKVAGTEVLTAAESYWRSNGAGGVESGGSAGNYAVKFTPATDSASAVLTLKNATIDGGQADGDENSAIYFSGAPLTLHLIGNNSVEKTQGGEWRNAIKADGDLTITAASDGALRICAGGGGRGNYGISCDGVPRRSLTIRGGTITAEVTDLPITSYTYAIYATGGITVEGGALSATVTSCSSSDAYAFMFTTFTKMHIKGGTVEASAKGTIPISTFFLSPELTGNYLDPNDRTVLAGNVAPGSVWDGITRLSSYPYVKIMPPAPIFTAEPEDRTVTEGGTAAFFAAAAGNPMPSYQWQVNDAGVWTDIPGATEERYTTEALTTAMSGRLYRCVASNGRQPDALSREATLTVNATPIPPIPPVPPVSSGNSAGMAGGEYAGNQYSASQSGAVWTVQAQYDRLTGVFCDSRLLTRGRDYSDAPGSTIITLTPSYLATLKDGAHTLRVQFTDGRYDGAFTTPLSDSVTAAAPGVPATGDAAVCLLPFALLGFFGAAYPIQRRRI